VQRLVVILPRGVPAMSVASRWLMAASLAAVAACYHPYRMPSPSEPHAMVKVRLVYHSRPGPGLAQHVLINGEQMDIPTPPPVGNGEISRAIPVRLEGLRWDVRSTFFHTVMVPQVQTYTTTSSYPCGTSTCVRSTTQTRTVMVATQVPDATCERAAGLGPQLDAVYLLNFDFYEDQHCTLACFRQLPAPDGTFQNAPCEPPPPPPK
jgi:hypothetical protein